MNLLEPLIGLAPVDTGERLYVNRIPNVNPDLIEAIAESDEKSEADPTGLKTIWQEVKDEAYDKLTADLLAEMAKRANFREVVETSQLPDNVSDAETFTADGDKMVGVCITMPKSQYQSLFIRSLFVSGLTGPAIIRFYDVDKGKRIGVTDMVVESEDNYEYPVKISIPCHRQGNRSVFIGVLVTDGETLDSIGWDTCCSYATNDLCQFPAYILPHADHLIETKECFVALEYEIRLMIDLVIDRFAERLKRSYAIMCAIGVIDRGLKSKKASRWTMVNRDAEKQNVLDLKDDFKKELAGACRLIYAQVEQEKLALVSRPDDQAGYYLGSYV
jgi:hypothetical protein